ncbi:hypothetical protein BaRGS_00007537, partial [Batillaria attramentaria]
MQRDCAPQSGSRGTDSSLSSSPQERWKGPRLEGSTSKDDDSICSEDVQVHRANQGNLTDGSTAQREVFLSLVWHGNKLGVAYYDLDCPQVSFMPDSPEMDNFTLLQQSNSKQDERLLKTLRKAFSEDEDKEEEDESHLLFLPSSDFSLEVSKRRILSLTLPALPSHSTETERVLYFSSILPLDNFCVIKAIGKTRSSLTMQLTVLFRSSIKKHTHLSTKEGLSLFGILNRCKSQIGSKRLRLWFLRPLKNRKILQNRLDTVAFFTQPRNMEALNSLQGCLKQIKNVARILARMIEAEAVPADWIALYKTVYHAVYIGDICRTQVQPVEIFKMIARKFIDDLHKIANLLSKTVDFEASTSQNHFVVKAGLDEVLDEKKRLYYGLPDLMTKVAREELARLGDNIKACNVIYMPQICYLLAIPKGEGMENEKDFEIPGLQFMFESNGVLHYKSARTKELDNMLGDTLCDIKDIETSIMHRLQNTIIEHSAVLLDVMEYAAELDCLMALASCAQEFGYICPELTEDSIIDVKKGRHPLQELCCSPFIPNDVQSGGAHPKVKILTGPNACGKSVYLKQVALIVYMAHIGSFVPAESAVVGQVDRIFSRIKSLESVSVGLSTFMLDINQMADALNNATSQSLVLVDEFGKGTETVDGLSLLCASLRHWLKKGASCPHIVVSTHFHSLVQQPVLPASPLLEFSTMETLQEEGELVFLFHLTQGHTSSSYAAHTALKAGLPPDIIQRGKEVSNLLCQGKPVHPVDDRGTETQLRRCEKIVQRFLQLDLDKDDVKGFLQNFVLPVSKGQTTSGIGQASTYHALVVIFLEFFAWGLLTSPIIT